MKAAIFKGLKQMACEEHAEPTIIDGGDAIIRVVRACVCGSDLWFYRDGSKEPNTQAGHEAIGVVEQIGDDVTVAKPGDFVIVPFPFSCGQVPGMQGRFRIQLPPRRIFRRRGIGLPGGIPARSRSRRHAGGRSRRREELLRRNAHIAAHSL